MVDLKLEAVDFKEGAKDLYVAVRVGEVQKLSKLQGTRNYKFNQATVGDRKFARVDVFRRVGSTSIPITNGAQTPTSEEVSCKMRDQDALKFKVHLAPESPEKRQKKIDTLAAAETNSKVLEAKTYLVEHNLEDRLSEAMQAVLRERPQDPAQFISDWLKSSSKDYVKLAPSGKSPVWSQKPSIGTWCSPRLDVSVPEAKASAKASTTPVSYTPEWSHKPSIGTWLGTPKIAIAPSPSSSVLALKNTAQAAMMKGAGDGSLQKALGIEPSVSVLQLKNTAQAAMMKGAGDGSLQKILEGKSTGPQLSDLRKEAHEALLKGARDGTLKNAMEETLKDIKPSSTSIKAEALRKEAKDTILKACNDGSLESTLQEAISSMGKATAPMSFSGKPSVGTWLMRPPTQMKEETSTKAVAPTKALAPPTAERPLVMIPTQMLYGSAFVSSGIRPNFVFR